MTPTLPGRWQTRIALLWTLGLALTVLLSWFFGLLNAGWRSPAFWSLFMLLGYVTLFGLVWDVVYDFIQDFRWEGDTPLAFHFIYGLIEGALIFALFRFDILAGLTYHTGDSWRFLVHYGSVFCATYWWVYGPMRVLAPRWRFRGGELV